MRRVFALPRWRQCFALVFGVVTLLSASGCGYGSGSLKGKVTMNGVPLRGGNVTFINKAGKKTASSAIAEDGSYQIDRFPTGEAQILVETESLNPTKVGKGFRNVAPQGQAAPANAGPSVDELKRRYIQIPAIYGKEDESPLTYMVTGGSQDFDVKLN